MATAQPGDSLASLASSYNVTLADLLAANNLNSSSSLSVDQQAGWRGGGRRATRAPLLV